jgi:hypothetical protein
MRIQEDGHYSTRRLVDSRETTMPYVCVVQSVAAREEGVPASCRGWMIYKERDVIPLKSQQTRDEEEHYADDEYVYMQWSAHRQRRYQIEIVFGDRSLSSTAAWTGLSTIQQN